MTTPDIRKANSILIIYPSAIGDVVMLISFLKIIKNNNPKAYITLVCASWGEQILAGQGLVNDFIIVNPTILNSPSKIIYNFIYIKKIIGRVNKLEHNYALELRGDLRYIFFMHFCKATRKVSYDYTGGEYLLTDVIKSEPTSIHLVEEKLHFARKIGCTFTEEETFPLLKFTKNQIEDVTLFFQRENLNNKFIIGVHPGSSLKNKTWKGFGELIFRINKLRPDISFLVFKGPSEEDAIKEIRQIGKHCKADIHISESTINRYLGRLGSCNLVISNDSGAGHIAAAYGVPVFVIFGPIEPDYAKPFAKKNVFVFSKNIACKPCLNSICEKNLECLKAVSVEEVFTKIKLFLQGQDIN